MGYRNAIDYAKEIEDLKDDPVFLKAEIEILEGERRVLAEKVVELEKLEAEAETDRQRWETVQAKSMQRIAELEKLLKGNVSSVDTSGFTVGERLYMGKDGLLTNVKPVTAKSQGVIAICNGEYLIFSNIKEMTDGIPRDINLKFKLIGCQQCGKTLVWLDYGKTVKPYKIECPECYEKTRNIKQESKNT